MIIHKQNIIDYLCAQRTVNIREPVFWKEYIDDLASPNIPMMDIMRRYVWHFKHRERIIKPLTEVYHFLKGIKK